MKVFVIAILFAYSSYGQSHFISVEPTGLPYQVIITRVTINGNTIITGSEIGVFDDTLCVGAAIFNGEPNLPITVWEESPAYNLKGFQTGNEMIFKLWTSVENTWQEINLYPTYQQGDGTFGSGAYSVVQLSTVLAYNSEFSRKNKEFLNVKVFPNPAVSNVQFTINNFSQSKYRVMVYNLLGEMIYSVGNGDNYQQKKIFTWNGQTNLGGKASSGIYLLVINMDQQFLSKKFVFIK